MIKVNFSYTDEFEQTTTLMKEYTEAVLLDTTEFEFLIDEFKKFLCASGFNMSTIDALQIVEE
jgi:hypothetical protein